MADREKIIKLIEEEINVCESVDQCYRTIDLPALRDILELLKEQEAVEPIAMQRIDGSFSFFVPYFLCGNCRYELVGKDVMFCSHCGKPIDWTKKAVKLE